MPPRTSNSCFWRWARWFHIIFLKGKKLYYVRIGPHYYDFNILSSCHQMSLKTSKRKSAIEQYWRTAFRFLFHCSNFDHTYMAKLIDKVNNGETKKLFNEKPTMTETYELLMKKSKVNNQNITTHFSQLVSIWFRFFNP